MKDRGVSPVTLLVLGTGLAACAPDLPQREDIADTRVLAIRVDVMEADPAQQSGRCEAMPLETVTIEPWIVDSAGPLTPEDVEALDPVWIACHALPRVGLGGCIGALRPLDPAEIPDCVPPDLDDVNGEDLPESPSPCRIIDGTLSRPELTVPLAPSFLIGGDIEITMVASTADEPRTERCLGQYLEKADSIADDCLFSVQRVPVGPDAQLLVLAEMLGVDVSDLGPVPDEIPEPDRNLPITSFRIQPIDENGPVGDFMELPYGATIELEYDLGIEMVTEIDPDDLQTYLVAENNEDFSEYEEQVFGLWFKTWGSLLGTDSQEVASRNVWTALPDGPDDDPAPDDVANVYYVVRDSRHGVDWWWFRVRLE